MCNLPVSPFRFSEGSRPVTGSNKIDNLERLDVRFRADEDVKMRR
jgi:hypothetical protein